MQNNSNRNINNRNNLINIIEIKVDKVTDYVCIQNFIPVENYVVIGYLCGRR
jgi:hypothetical protein